MNGSRPLKRVVVVAPHFPPCNLAGVHRSRLFVRHLKEFGYEPIVLSVDPQYYEEPLDPELERLLPQDLRIIKTAALPTKPIRLVGDIGIRSFWHHLRTLCKLIESEPIDLLFIPIPPNYTCLLGPLLWRKYRVPYVIDYIDPWIYRVTPREKTSLKALASHVLSRLLEPMALRHVGGITSVASGYYEGVLQRHPRLRRRPKVAMPYGADPEDHEFVRRTERKSCILEQHHVSESYVLAYAGAMLPRARATYAALFEAMRKLASSDPRLANRLHLLFIGTTARAGDDAAGLVKPFAEDLGVASFVTEVARRQSYLEVLATLARVHAIMILGSSERHYTPSKVFQALHSRRPILAILHEESTAVEMLEGLAGVELITFSSHAPVETKVEEIQSSLWRILNLPRNEYVDYDASILEQHSARRMTRILTECFDAVLQAANRPNGTRQPAEALECSII